jgi:hypothetical protein
MIPQNSSCGFFDSEYKMEEQLPRNFTISFKEISVDGKKNVRILFNHKSQVGDMINDNAYKDDFYRYHDIFHYSFATLLGWSPCTRAMLKRKRKSSELLDEIEDGARATITEEALSMIIFNEAKHKDYFKSSKKVSKTTLRIIKEMTENFEVKVRSTSEWEKAILKSYNIFRSLVQNNGGTVEFNLMTRKITFVPI